MFNRRGWSVPGLCLAALLLTTIGGHVSGTTTAQTTQVQVQAEDYRSGGAGVAYYDSTPSNAGGAYRSDDVDIRTCNDGAPCHSVGWWSSGEWLEYDVSIPSAGTYAVTARSASGVAGNQLTVSVAGRQATLSLPTTGSAATFGTTASAALALPQGTQRLRITGTGNSYDVNYLTFTLQGGSTPLPTAAPTATPASGEPPLLPGPMHQTLDGPFFQPICAGSHTLRDDPIIYPGRPGASHEHRFFGATRADANSTYAELLDSPTSCDLATDTAAYWAPTLYDANGTLHQPKQMRAYYFANTRDPATLRSFPANLRIIAGDSRATAPQPLGVIEFHCRDRQDQSGGRDIWTTYYNNNTPPQCSSSEYLSVAIRFPDCWDGVRLDSSDHRRHMAYSDEEKRCPATHPVKLPKLRLSITYESHAGYSGFSGGRFTLGGPSGSAYALPWQGMHADFWNTWDQAALDRIVDGCLRRRQNTGGTACR